MPIYMQAVSAGLNGVRVSVCVCVDIQTNRRHGFKRSMWGFIEELELERGGGMMNTHYTGVLNSRKQLKIN